MMKNRNTIEDEIDSIRIALYEATKGMAAKELNDYIQAQTAATYKYYGLKPVSSIEEHNLNKRLKSKN
jgi:hypothetical protein